MANLSNQTRQQQVLAYLEAHVGEWVDGPDLANERVGGSEGLKRARELRLNGHPIETRKHPDPNRDIWQYRLKPKEPERTPVALPRYETMPTRVAFGEAIPCPRCEGKKKSTDPITKKFGECTRCNGFGIVPVRNA